MPPPDVPATHARSPYVPPADVPARHVQSPYAPPADVPAPRVRPPYVPPPDVPATHARSPYVAPADVPARHVQSPYVPPADVPPAHVRSPYVPPADVPAKHVDSPYVPPADVPASHVPPPYVPRPYAAPASAQRDAAAAPLASPEPAVLRGRDDRRRAPGGHDDPVFPSRPPVSARDSDDDGDAFGYREPYAPYRQDDVGDAKQQARDLASPRDHRAGIYAHRDAIDVDGERGYVPIPGEARTRYDDSTDAGMAPPIFMDEEVQRRRTVVARLWAAGCLLGLVLLCLQGLYIYRTAIATAVPALRPALEAVCGQLGCQVGYARRLERISITASSLQPQAGAGAAAADDGRMRLVLAVTIRNRYDKPQPWPALVLQLTDLSDTVVVRKVLLPENYLPPGTQGPFPAGGEQSLSVPLQVDGPHVNGYQLDKFFP
jgi:hypothetical protein